MKKKYWNLLLGGILTIGVVALAFWNQRTNSMQKVKPRIGNVVESIYGLGTVTADQVFHLRGGLTFSIRKLFVREGQVVSAGTSLVQLDESIIRSPIDGTVTEVAFKQGEVIPPQVPVVTVTNLKNLYLEVSLEQQSVLRIQPQQKVAVSFESLRNEKVDGIVRSVFPKSNQFIVRIELNRWPEGVLPGMTADTAILVGEKKNVLLIPIKAISSGKLIRVRDGKREKVSVQLGVVDGQWAEIISDQISEQDEILVKRE
ncbi:MAG: efflux RND transporter periplasmic adaptor subunit [Pseudobdellovibrionaceae bacterium]